MFEQIHYVPIEVFPDEVYPIVEKVEIPDYLRDGKIELEDAEKTYVVYIPTQFEPIKSRPSKKETVIDPLTDSMYKIYAQNTKPDGTEEYNFCTGVRLPPEDQNDDHLDIITAEHCLGNGTIQVIQPNGIVESVDRTSSLKLADNVSDPDVTILTIDGVHPEETPYDLDKPGDDLSVSTNMTGTIFGYGIDPQTNKLAKHLKQGRVKVDTVGPAEDSLCNQIYENLICVTQDPLINNDNGIAKGGDSGGLFLIDKEGEQYVAGIIVSHPDKTVEETFMEPIEPLYDQIIECASEDPDIKQCGVQVK